ncbi:MAG: DUF429 domain-containing protein [Chloroflexota bacterium]
MNTTGECATVGVDLSTDVRRTGLCTLAWKDRRARVLHLAGAATDAQVAQAAAGAAHVAIDVPFGWPGPWADAVAAHRPGLPFTAQGTPAELTRRFTDAWVTRRTGLYPLPVAANLIGATAIRGARLLHQLQRPVDYGLSDEPGSVSEVYPAAALKCWGQAFQQYKGTIWRAARERLIEALCAAGLPVVLDASDRLRLAASDDALDSLLCAVLARAIQLGLTEDAPVSARERVRREGWIRLPLAGSTIDLVQPPAAAASGAGNCCG